MMEYVFLLDLDDDLVENCVPLTVNISSFFPVSFGLFLGFSCPMCLLSPMARNSNTLVQFREVMNHRLKSITR